MINMENKVVLITGDSSGIGKTCAEFLVKRGLIVYGGSRKQFLENCPWKHLLIDVTNIESINKGIEYIIKNEKKIDILINSAGINIVGPVEETSIDEAKYQLEVNFFGVFHMCYSILPFMRKQKSGLIINIGSIGGLIGLPFQAFYCASKFGLEGFTESLRMEVKYFGIKVTNIDPGDVATTLTENRIFIKRYTKDSIYYDVLRKAVKIFEKNEREGSSPEIVAYKIWKIINKKNIRTNYLIGSLKEKTGVFLKKILPANLFEKLMEFEYNLIKK